MNRPSTSKLYCSTLSEILNLKTLRGHYDFDLKVDKVQVLIITFK